MPDSHLSATHLHARGLGFHHGGAAKPFQPHALSTKAALACVARQWDRQALRGPIPQHRGARRGSKLGLVRRINWSTVLTLTFNVGVWMFMAIVLSMVID